ncbi:peroxisomal targeting signal 2 receptor [Peziza echinospora]|nr:peroxisomal targeting signal 2 receptor [Peziza echinospora]
MYYYRTTGFNGYSVKYSPFYDSRLAVSSAANFGLVGNGRLHILNLTPSGIQPLQTFDTNDGLFDVAWSEANEHHLAVASGDGSIKLFDTGASATDGFPVAGWKEHTREVFCVAWDGVMKEGFVSSSWDGTVRFWRPEARGALRAWNTGSCTYSAAFSPHEPGIVSCVASDSMLRIFDLRANPAGGGGGVGVGGMQNDTPVLAIKVPGASELLTHDWNKYRSNTIATGGVDRVVRVFDLRQAGAGAASAGAMVHGGLPAAPVSELRGHEYGIRKVAWSPHWPGVLMSGGYDMSVRIWEDGLGEGMGGAGVGTSTGIGRMLGVMDKHTEFVAGLDWCLFGGEGWAASVGWDEGVWVWDANAVVAGVR